MNIGNHAAHFSPHSNFVSSSSVNGPVHTKLYVSFFPDYISHNATGCDAELSILVPAYNEYGYNEHPAITSRFLCIKIMFMQCSKVRLQ